MPGRPPAAPPRGLLHRIGPSVRDAALVLGVAFALFLGLEMLYRAQAAIRTAIGLGAARGREPSLSQSPYADTAWYREFMKERARFRFRWEPSVYIRGAPQSGRYINVNSSGLRVVPRYPVNGGVPVKVFFFGGSTTWGNFDRDSSTRPARVARALAAAGFDAEVVNFGQPGYTSAQELVTLLTELRRGHIPDAVVFWDGVHDVAAMRQNRRPGVSVLEGDRADDFAFGSRRRANEGAVGVRVAIRSLLAPSALFTRLFEAVARPASGTRAPPPAAFCRALMADWLGHARVVDRLARAYDFMPLVIWQPQWQTSGSPRSAYERMAETTLVFREVDSQLRAHRLECARVADSLVAAHAAESIRNWASLHRGDTATVFVDRYSNTVERATAIEADSLSVELIDGLRRTVCPRRPVDAACRRPAAGTSSTRR